MLRGILLGRLQPILDEQALAWGAKKPFGKKKYLMSGPWRSVIRMERAENTDWQWFSRR